MRPSEAELVEYVRSSVNDILRAWSLDAEITANSFLVHDLGFTSMDILQMLAKIETGLKRKLPYDRLLLAKGGGFRQDLSVQDLGQFLYEYYDVVRAEAGAI